MKIISSPLSPPPPNWWHNLQVNCPKCRAVIELETFDKVEVTAERRLGGKVTGKITCPVPLCFGHIRFDKPT